MVKKIILKTDIKREKDFLYFCGTDEKTGCLTIGQSPMVHGPHKKKVVAKGKIVPKVVAKKVIAKKVVAKTNNRKR